MSIFRKWPERKFQLSQAVWTETIAGELHKEWGVSMEFAVPAAHLIHHNKGAALDLLVTNTNDNESAEAANDNNLPTAVVA